LQSSETLNLAGPEEWTLRGIGETIGKVLGVQPRFEVQTGATAPCVVGDISRLRQVLGWAPAVSFGDGMRLWLGESMNKQAA
jgi:nucleoside-diphosphate-sugar epimerase